jgi:hypothetical protein
MSIRLKEYKCVNAEKMDRAINGSMSSGGRLANGVGMKATEGEKLAKYDMYGGLIENKDGYKVKAGCFWDFKAKKRFAKPEVMLEIRSISTGKIVFHPESKKLTPDLIAGAEEVKAKKEVLKKKAKKKSKKK